MQPLSADELGNRPAGADAPAGRRASHPGVRSRGAVREIAPGDPLRLARGDCVVCIPVYGGYQLFTQCLESVLRHTPAGVNVLIADDCSPEDLVLPLLRDLESRGALDRTVYFARQSENVGFVVNVNRAFAACDRADVVVLNSDCVVAEGWFEGLRAAAHSDSGIATSSTLTNHGTILSVPHRNQPGALPRDWTVDAAAAAIREASPRLRPRLPTAIGHCMYVKRTALDLVGDFDPEFSPGYGEEVDFSQRCLLRGLSHVAADEVFVWHQGGASFALRPAAADLRQRHERLIASRYPYYHRLVAATAAQENGALARSLAAARRALLGMSVTVDGSCLGPDMTGTQVAILELIRALSHSGVKCLRVLVPDRYGEDAQRFLSELGTVEVISCDSVGTDVSKTDIVHRPFQVGTEGELERLQRLGDRLILTQQDMIAYRNPGYFPRFEDWWRYRRASRYALSMADAVVFYSAHARADALAEDLVAPERTHVVGVGTDHRLAAVERPPQRPPGAGALEDGDFLLCLGADYRHKNRVFALQLLGELQRRHGWRGRLALVGPRVPWGSSAPEEAEFLGRHPAVATATVHLAGVSEAEKLWLLQRAAGVVFPTVYEGFGLVPFEAAAAGIPCFFAAQSSLAEVLPAEAATLTAWDPALSADEVIAVLRDPRRAEDLVASVRRSGERHRWDAVAERLMTVYQLAADGPRRVGLGRELVDAGISLVGGGLMGELAALSVSDQAALGAVARRRYLRVPFFGLLQVCYRMGRLLVAPFRHGRDRDLAEPPHVVPQRIDTPGGSEKLGVMPPTASST